MISIVTGDPGYNDPFGIIGTQYNSKTNKLEFMLAKQIIKKPDVTAARYFQKIKKIINPTFMGIETNNNGKRLLRRFREKYNMPYMQGIVTSSNISEAKRQTWKTMDKSYMIQWFKTKQKEGFFVFPEKLTPDMEEFQMQTQEIVRLETPNGSTTYKRVRGRHDDLFMAALLNCNVIRVYLEEQENNK